MEEIKDKLLWKQAKKRVSFKRHLAMYLVVNAFLWAIWLFTGRPYDEESVVPWPAWSSLGWGIGVVFSYLGAYVFIDKYDNVEKEYQKLKG